MTSTPPVAQSTIPLPTSVATVESWTNGSYWRNYKLEWTGQAEQGDQLCLQREVEAYGDARAAEARSAEHLEMSVDVNNLADAGWYWVRYEGLGQVYTAPARYQANVDCWYSHEFSGIPTRHLTVLRALPTPL